MNKKFRTAKAGQTTDGRVIPLDHIQQMAKNYDPKKYGARINLEHIKGFHPEGLFKMYGDVVALSVDEEDGETYLVAEIEPTDDLIQLSKNKQKVYFSIEYTDKFADTGEAYLMGLACTDSPASLGTSYMKFCQAHKDDSPLAGRKSNPDNIISTAEFSATFEQPKAPKKSVFDFVSTLFTNDDKQTQDHDDVADALKHLPQNFADLQKAMLEMAKAQDEHAKNYVELTNALAQQRQDVVDLTKILDSQPDTKYTPRPIATGGDGQYMKTDC